MLTRSRLFATVLGALLATPLAAAIAAPAAKPGDEPISFKDDVKPILEYRCVACHQPGGEGLEKSGLDLRSYEGLMTGTKFGKIVVPGDALTSNLNVLVEGRAPKIRMPHGKKKLSQCDQDTLRSWVNQGAKNN